MRFLIPTSFIPLLALSCILTACSKSNQAAPLTPPPAVEVITLLPQDISLDPEYPARTRGSNEADIRSRISGILLKRYYVAGSTVKEGDLLFQIDPELYQAEVDRASAQLEQAQAHLQYAEYNWNRVSQLFKEKAVSEQIKDQGFYDLQSAKAEVSSAKAQLNTAKINLGYTTVRASAPGVTNLQTFDEGSLIEVNTLLTHITTLDPLYVMFSYPDREFFKLRQILTEIGDGKKLDIEMIFANGQPYSQPGYIDFTDSTINRQTGTVQVRSVFPNPNAEILSGEFVRVILKGVVLKNALLVPQEAVMQGPQGTFVYCVDKQNIAKTVPIKIGPSKDNYWVVEKGLSAGDTVITVGMIKVRPDQPVQIIPSPHNPPNK